MYEDVITICGKKRGPVSMILVGVHGNEICGMKAINELLPDLKIDAGKLIIAYGNPRAIKINARFKEANLNRMFKSDNQLSKEEKNSYEYKRAQFLKKYLDQADVLLDIHASFTPQSPRFIICKQKAFKITSHLPVKYIVSGFDVIQPGGTDYYMNQRGKIGICLECGYARDKSSITCAKEGIQAFLSTRGHLKAVRVKYKQTYYSMYNMYITKTKKFMLARKFKDFEKIKKGQLICKDGVKTINADKDSIILFAQSKPGIGNEAFLLGKQKSGF